jgi:hypothetical protein
LDKNKIQIKQKLNQNKTAKLEMPKRQWKREKVSRKKVRTVGYVNKKHGSKQAKVWK